MLEPIDGILAATDGLSSREILESYIVIRAVERSLQIISEAAKERPAELVALEPDVPWRSIVGIGNLLRHEYYRIRNDDIIDLQQAPSSFDRLRMRADERPPERIGPKLSH